jgi:hypothetical protein
MDGEKKIKKIKNTLVLTPHAFEKWIIGKTPFIKIFLINFRQPTINVTQLLIQYSSSICSIMEYIPCLV